MKNISALLLLIFSIASNALADSEQTTIVSEEASSVQILDQNNRYDEIAKARIAIRNKNESQNSNVQEDTVASAQNSDLPVTNMLQGLMLCLGAFAFLVFILKKTQKVAGNGTTQNMKLIERLALTQKSQLVLIEINGKRFLVGTGSESVSIANISASLVSERNDGPIIELKEAV